uniref:Selenoprotein M n=1 Tax=Malurus cyaneus samueli TaxID=2593467 RepID=A0A8C5TPT1_9PASS
MRALPPGPCLWLLLAAALAAGGDSEHSRLRGAVLRDLARGKVEVSAAGGPGGRLHGPAQYCSLLDTLPSHNLEMKHLPGADPELVLLNHRYEELERIPLSDMTREEINQLVQELGFYRKETPDAPVPEEFQFAPAKPLPTDALGRSSLKQRLPVGIPRVPCAG